MSEIALQPVSGKCDDDRLIKTIQAHITKGDQARDKAEQHYIAAGRHLLTLKGQTPDQATFLEIVRDKIGLGKTRIPKLPGPKTANKIAAETKRPVLASDGYFYFGTDPEKAKEGEDRRTMVFGVRRAH